MTKHNYIYDVTTKNFVEKVIDPSKERLVIVDFLSLRSGISKKLSPILDKFVIEENGAAILAHINIDENPQFVQQLQLETAPTIFAFSNGKVLDGFVGMIPDTQIKAWIQKLIKATNSKAEDDESGDTESALEQAEKCFEEDDFYTANAIYLDVLDYAPNEPRAHAGVMRCLLAESKTDEAQQRLNDIPELLARDNVFDIVRATLDLAQQTNSVNGETEKLEKQIDDTPNDHQARFDLALAYYAEKKNEDAVEALLEIITRDRSWKKDKARKQLLKLMEAFGPTNPITINARKRLSSILFS